jgi:hypothetical protein
MKKILIFGFPHSGTTILRTILGHIPKIYTVLEETPSVDHLLDQINSKEYEYVLFKNPVMRREYFQKNYHEINKIFIIRNPLFTISSYNARYKKKSNDQFKKNVVDCYLEMAQSYLYYQDKKIPNLHFIKYEDIFENNFLTLKDILNKIGLKFTDNIFNNKEYKNISHKNQETSKIPNFRPDDEDHDNLRFYQVNQEFNNNNKLEKIYLSKYQLDRILNDESTNQIYPELLDFDND